MDIRPAGWETPVEGFAVETCDGLIFTVKGLVHPPRRTIAYLRYVPDDVGDRRRDGRGYRRVYRFADQLAELRARELPYLTHDPAFGVRLQTVPDADVCRVHDPRARLRELAVREPDGELEQAAVAFCDLLEQAAAVEVSALGITGSLLFGLQNDASDLDIVVYGGDACRAVHGALGRLFDDDGSQVQRPDRVGLAAIAAGHREDTPISDADFQRLQARKVNEGRFRGRTWFVRFVRRPDEVRDRYGDPRYEPLGAATIRGRIDDASDALFTPCSYVVGDAETVEGATVPATCEVVSFRGRFSDQARRGEVVHAKGTLERVIRRAGPASARLTVGAPGDFLVSRPG